MFYYYLHFFENLSKLLANLINFFTDSFITYFSDDTWVHDRKFLEESFQLDIIKNFVTIFIDSSNQMIASINDKLNIDIKNEQHIDIFKLTSRCALTMVLATSFGITASEVHFDDEILKAVEE